MFSEHIEIEPSAKMGQLIIVNLHHQHCAKSVRIVSYSGPYSVRMRENTDQNNSEYGHFSRNATHHRNFWKYWLYFFFAIKYFRKFIIYTLYYITYSFSIRYFVFSVRYNKMRKPFHFFQKVRIKIVCNSSEVVTNFMSRNQLPASSRDIFQIF